MPAELNDLALKQSVQAFPESGMARSPYSTWFVPSATDLLPAWYARSCDYALRLYFARIHNTLLQGAVNSYIQQVLSTPFKITGEDTDDVEHYQSLFLEGDFGDGVDSFMGKFLLDFLTQNFGGVIEIIGPGAPDKALTGAPTGLAHLDAYQCWATGSKEMPIAYESSESGKLHFLHHTRVIRLTDMPSANERVYGYGMCGLYRAMSVANAQILMGKHQNEKLSDLPPAGLLKLGNVKPGYWQTIKDRYSADSNKGGSQVWNNIIEIESIDPTNPIEVEFVSFSQLPDNFNYKEYLEAHVNMIALALNMDPQDIWPLTGASLGTGTQSKILNAKARGKGYGYMLKRLERVWNRCVLPRDMEFAYEYKDEEQDREVAETAQLWIQIARDMPGDEKQKRQLLANQVEALADVYLDPDGSLIELPDDDPKDAEQDDTIAQDFTPLDTTGSPADTTTASSAAPISTVSTPAPEADALPASNVTEFKDIKAKLDAGLITMTQAQKMIGQVPDSALDGLYVVNDMPVPREKIRELWQAHFGRGVASFDTVISGTALEATTGASIPGSDVIGDTAKPAPPPPFGGAPNIPIIGKVYERIRRTTTRTQSAGTNDAGRVLRMGAEPTRLGDVERRAGLRTDLQTKAIQSTLIDFESDVQDAIEAGQDGDMARRRFGVIMRDLLRRHGTQSYKDGLADGGVEVDGLDGDDQSTFNSWLTEQSSYVTGFANTLFSGESEIDAESRATLWGRKSLMSAYELGRESADRNGLYEFTGEDGEDSCDDCSRLQGQVHRLWEWNERELNPRGMTFKGKCGGWRCVHYLDKTTGRPSGSW